MAGCGSLGDGRSVLSGEPAPPDGILDRLVHNAHRTSRAELDAKEIDGSMA